MRLYKFVASSYAAIKLAQGSLKFTPIAQLNDPTELLSVMDHIAVRESLEQLRRNGFTLEQFRWLKHQEATLDLLAPEEKILRVPDSLESANQMLRMHVYDHVAYMQERLFATIENIRSRVGVLALTERYDSLPMWAHYANNAKGFVVQFDTLDLAFRGDATGSLNTPKPVIYGDKFVGMTFDPATQDRLFFSKLSDWRYEREWRVVTALDQCRHLTNDDLFLRDIPATHVSAIICGWRVSALEVLTLTENLAKVGSPARVKHAKLEGSQIVISEHRK